MNAKPSIASNATYTLHPDDTVAFAELGRRLGQAGRASPGCVYFQVAQDVEDPSQFHLIEGWSDEKAAAAFNQSEGFKGLLSQAIKLRIMDRRGIKLEVSGAEPLSMPS